MKLKHKLSITFTILCFILLNLFGTILIQSIFNTSLKDTIDACFKETSVILLRIDSAKHINQLFFTDHDILQNEAVVYLNNSKDHADGLQITNTDKELVFTSLHESEVIPETLYEITHPSMANYIITNQKQRQEVWIHQQFEFHQEAYYLTSVYDISSLYEQKNFHFILLLMFNLIAGIISVLVIYVVSSEITKPLSTLNHHIAQMIDGNYTEKLTYESNIKEVNELVQSYDTMSDEIRETITLLEKSNDEKQRFIDSLTHEIRTPLTSIIGYSSLYLNKEITNREMIKKSFEDIYHNGKRIEQLTENLIKLITLNQNSLTLRHEHIKTLLEEALTSFQTTLEQEHITCDICGEDFIIETDAYLHTILCSNLIDNAIKAVRSKEQREIHICLSEHSICIQDNGKGIPKADLDKIFEPFFMVDPSREKTFAGFGLGLSICYHIMQLLQISFHIESKESVGTSITLNYSEVISHEEG